MGYLQSGLLTDGGRQKLNLATADQPKIDTGIELDFVAIGRQAHQAAFRM